MHHRSVIPVLLAMACSQAYAAGPAAYYPTKEWRESTPEEQGLDSQVLAGMVDNISRKQKITVSNLLSMQPGLGCGFAPGEQELEQMRRTNEWLKYTLALPMKYEPGTKFGYCSPGYHVLSSIVTAVTHEPLVEFGRK